MALIKQTSSEYYEGEAVYNPTGTATNAVVWPSSLTPLIWDASATPTSVNNFKVFIDFRIILGKFLNALGPCLAHTLHKGWI